MEANRDEFFRPGPDQLGDAPQRPPQPCPGQPLRTEGVPGSWGGQGSFASWPSRNLYPKNLGSKDGMSPQTHGWKQPGGETSQPAPAKVNPNKETPRRQHMNAHWLKLIYAKLTCLLLITLFTPDCAQAQSGCSPAPSSIVAWWPAEDHAYDI